MSFLFDAKILLPALYLSAGFIILDGAWLALLPRLGISYGEVPPALAAFVGLRAGVLVLWAACLAGLGMVLPGTMPGGAIPPGAVWILAVLNLLLLGVALYAFYVEPLKLTVERIQVPVPGLTHPVRIVQLSDIHVEHPTRRERALPGLVAGLQPDMIVLTGDYLNKSFKQNLTSLGELGELLAQLHAPLGIYSVNGNMDRMSALDDLLLGLHIHILAQDVLRIPALGDHFVIVGLHNYLRGDQFVLARLMAQVKSGDFSLLLYHKPDLAYVARDLGVSLYLAGHTHGGQVRLPLYGALYTNSRYGKTFEMGLYHLGGTTLYISRGLGMVGGAAGLRARFLCPPEVTVMELVPAGTPGTAEGSALSVSGSQ